MNSYSLDQIKVGMEETFSVTVTESMMDSFCKLSGDVNPLHISKEFAQEKGLKNRVCYGMLTASFYSTLAGVYLPGKNCLLHSVDAKFTKPVFPGDVLTVKGEVTDVQDVLKFITVKATVKNQNGEIVSKAKINAGVFDNE